MSWQELLKREIDYTYGVAEQLMDLVDDDKLDWKPPTGDNWMTTGQLLQHITTACGGIFRGFATGDWGFPADVDVSQLKPEEMLPPAESMPSIESVAAAKQALADDKKIALDSLAGWTDDDLANKPAPAPWDPTRMILGHRLLNIVSHLKQHKGQLYYYLKIQGKPVNTSNLWGM